jgi:two-component system, chemotaxis family, sensor kinase CheA
MDDELKEFREMFFEEAGENLQTLEAGLLHLETAGDDDELLNGVFRAAHSIKGGAASFGLTDVSGFAHVMEGLLDQIRRHERKITSGIASLLLRATDMLRGLMDAARLEQDLPPGVDALKAELEHARSQPHDGRDAVPQDSPALAEAPGLVETSSVVDEAVVASETVVETEAPAPVASEATPGPNGYAELWSANGPDQVVGNGRPAADARRRNAESDAQANASIRVSVRKVDSLVDLVGELVISQSIVTQIAQAFTPDRLTQLNEALADVERNTRELQERVMRMRMVPVASVFQRFNRVVRDLATTCGKRVKLVTAGEDTEIDKGMIELLGDPLTHLVRNAVDHGLEPEADRVAAGKPGEGTVSLVARTEGGSVTIDVCDDGKGLDRDRIRRKAIERGLLRPEDNPTEEQIFGMIFQPGFSTAATVTDVSGRGVGLDVVKRNVERLNGTLQVESEPGKGSVMRIRLPLTLAILDGLVLSVGSHPFVVPLAGIEESLRPTSETVHEVLGQGEVVIVRGESIPLLHTSRLLGLPSRLQHSTEGLVVIAIHQGKRFALLVEEVLGQQQVVIKNLDANYRRIEGTMGATIMGDGRVALILDVAGLARLHAGKPLDADLGLDLAMPA